MKLPASIILPARPFIGQSELLDEIAVSRVSLLKWRKFKGFPNPVRRDGTSKLYNTAEIASFLRESGTNVRIV